MTPATRHLPQTGQAPCRQARQQPLAAAVALTLALAGGAALAQATGGTPGTAGSSASGRAGSTAGSPGSMGMGSPGSASGVAASDRNFMTRAAGSGLFEVEVARLAADKASDESVKRFANMLAEQHTANNQELMSLASAKGVTLPTSMPADKRRIVDKLAKQSGPEFDKEFVQAVGIKDHQEDIRMFQSASREVKDPELKSWATKTLPVLQQHLAEARKLPMAGGSSNASRNSGSNTSSASDMSGPSSMGASGETGSSGGSNGSSGASGAGNAGGAGSASR